MCGIVGIFGHANDIDLMRVIGDMVASLIHRGPDDDGIWGDDEAEVALGHRRLSVLDLSQEGHQPMLSACGRYVMVFNGEIYNHIEIRSGEPMLANRRGFASYRPIRLRRIPSTEFSIHFSTRSTPGETKSPGARNGSIDADPSVRSALHIAPDLYVLCNPAIAGADQP